MFTLFCSGGKNIPSHIDILRSIYIGMSMSSRVPRMGFVVFFRLRYYRIVDFFPSLPARIIPFACGRFPACLNRPIPPIPSPPMRLYDFRTITRVGDLVPPLKHVCSNLQSSDRTILPYARLHSLLRRLLCSTLIAALDAAAAFSLRGDKNLIHP